MSIPLSSITHHTHHVVKAVQGSGGMGQAAVATQPRVAGRRHSPPPGDIQELPFTRSLHRGAAAGFDPRPADLQPGQLGTVLEELLDGDVTNVQLRRQRVLLLHCPGQLLKHF